MSTAQSVVHLGIDGMSCGHCVSGVTRALAVVPGVAVKDVVVGSARIEVSNAAAADAAVAAVGEAGFTARVVPAPAAVKKGCCGGMSCCK